MSILRVLLIPFSIILFLAISCSYKKKENENTLAENIKIKRAILDSLNKAEVTKLNSNFNAVTGKDTTIDFTFQLQEKCLTEKRPISIYGNVIDIVKRDSMYLLKIRGDFLNKTFFAELVMSPLQLQNIYTWYSNVPEDGNLSSLRKFTYRNNCFVFYPTLISSKSMLSIDSYVKDDYKDSETAQSSLSYEYDNMYLFRGNLIEYYLYKDE